VSTRRGLFHVHSWHSFDGLLPPWAYLAHARRARLDFLCVTDHNTLAGARAVAAGNRDPRLEVVIGAEYATDRADVIGLFLREEVRSRRFGEAVAEIQAQGGIAVLPHPFRHRGEALDEELVAAVDAVEVFNARSGARENALAAGPPRRPGGTASRSWPGRTPTPSGSCCAAAPWSSWRGTLHCARRCCPRRAPSAPASPRAGCGATARW
jgi:hypothetical protein